MDDITKLRDAALAAEKKLDELEHQQFAAREEYREEYRDAMTAYAAAVAWKAYGFRVGDIIQFTYKSGIREREEIIQMKITRFNAWLSGESPDRTPSIDGIRVKKDGTLGTKEDHCHPALSREYFDVKLVKKG